jgi:hypothetical protein
MPGIPNTKEATFTDGVTDRLNVNTSAGQVEVPNGTPIKGYSDAYITATWQLINGTLALAQSATAPDPGANGTIATQNLGLTRVNPAAARTGVILQAGTVPGQLVVVENLAASANSITFAAAGTSFVADGTGDSIAGGTSGLFNWDSIANLWYRVKAS